MTKYEKRYDELIFDLKISGKSSKDIAKHLGISRKTLYNWINDNKPLKKLYEKACNVGIEAKQSLIKRATGFEYKEKEKEFKNVDGDRIVVKEKESTKYYPPDVSAIKYLLQNISTFDKELEHRIRIDIERLDNDKFEKWFTVNELRINEEVKKLYEKELLRQNKDS
jgi:hypothetical protein